MMVNGLVVAVVIWLAGVSVKDFACVVVGQFETVGEETTRSFNQTMQFYLWRASVLAVVVAALVHYFFVRKLLSPLKRLTESTQALTRGVYPEPIPAESDDEIGSLTRNFNRMTETLQREEQHRKRLMSNISHELRTPLSNLNGYLEALTNGVIDGDRELFRSLHEESQHLSRLVEQLHSLSVWEARRITVQEKSLVEIQGLCRQVVQTFQLESVKKEIAFHQDVQPCEIWVHEQGIKQVMTNVVANAVLYSIGNDVWIRGEVSDGNFLISITNHGKPIPDEVRPYIFERFVKSDPSRKRNGNQEGTGLGLAIVKEIVEQHGGQVGLSSAGTKHTFWFTIPL